MTAWSAILALGCVFTLGCTSPSDDPPVEDNQCAALRDHLIGLRLPDLDGIDPAHRDAYLRALGDEIVASCLESIAEDPTSHAPIVPR